MPTYDYICASCGERTEFMHGVHAPGPEACPRCGGGPLRKAMHAPTVHFKGSGWAKKERASSGGKPARDPNAPVTAGSGDSGDGAGTAADKGASGEGSADRGASGEGSADSGTRGEAGAAAAAERPAKPAPTGTAEA